MPKLLTPEEVKEFFKLKDVATVYTWIQEGFIKNAHKIKGTYRIPESEIARILEETKV